MTVRRVLPYSDAGTQVDATNIKERIHVHTYQFVSFISSISFVSMCICVHDYMRILMDICVHICVDICKCTCLQENDEMNLIPVYAQTKVSCSCKHMHMCIYATHNVLVFGGNLLILPASPFRRVLVHTTCLFAPCHEPVWQTCFVVNVTLSAMSCVLTPLRVATCVTRTTDIKHLHVIWLAWANVSKRSYCKTRQGPQKAFMSFCASWCQGIAKHTYIDMYLERCSRFLRQQIDLNRRSVHLVQCWHKLRPA